jgi:general stress protein YciG
MLTLAYRIVIRGKNMKTKMLTVAEAGRKGGKKTLATHGPEFYSEIGRKGGKAKVSKGHKKVLEA